MSGSLHTGWITNENGVSYPPSPWHLGGVLYGSFWLIPLSELPVSPPEGTKLITLGKRALVVTVWGLYTPGGVLSYNEMMLALAVRVKLRPAVTITHIWVDSASSAAGGQALWGIPKRLGRFRSKDGGIFEADLSDEAGPVASFRFVPGLSLPGRWRIPMQIAQMLHGRLKQTSLQALGRLQFGHGIWRFDEAGSLDFLNGRKPLFSVRLDRMVLSFGMESFKG